MQLGCAAPHCEQTYTCYRRIRTPDHLLHLAAEAHWRRVITTAPVAAILGHLGPPSQ